MKEIAAIFVSSICLLVNVAHGECSSASIKSTEYKLGQAQGDLEAAEDSLEKYEAQREKRIFTRDKKLGTLFKTRDRRLLNLATKEATYQCINYPAQCVTQLRNLKKSLDNVNKSIRNIKASFDGKISKLDSQIHDLLATTIPELEAEIVEYQSQLESCSALV